MADRDKQREWLADSKGWAEERDAVGLERLVDVLQLISACGMVSQIDLRRWSQLSPTVTAQLKAARAALNEANRLMMSAIQERVEANRDE